MSDMLDYYKEYFAKGGEYTMERAGKSSRVIQILDWLNIHVPKHGSVLDIGCGDMALSSMATHFEWTGVDINTEKAKGNAIQHDIMSAPYPLADHSFDAIVCSEVLEHVWDMRVIHKEARRLLKKDGYYIISTPNFDWIDHVLEGWRQVMYNTKYAWTLEHIRHYNFPTHEQYLKETGFTIKDFTGADAHYGAFFNEARSFLKHHLVHNMHRGEYAADGLVDQILGRMFRKMSHTICIIASVS